MTGARPGGGPLSGVRVVDFGQYFAGPLACLLLADQGAEIIRIDPPGGPRLRHRVNAFLLRGRGSLELDLKTATGHARAMELIAAADVLVENFRPGVMQLLGLGPAECRERNPRLVYASLPGFAAADVRAGMAGWEGVVMAASGAYWRPPGGRDASSMFFGTTSDGVPKFSPLPLASVFAAGLAATGIMAALVARERDGLGQRVEVPLFDAMLEANGMVATSIEREDVPLPVLALGTGLYRCADGRAICLLVVQYRHFLALVDAARLRDWAASGLLDFHALITEPQRAAHLRARLAKLFATRTALDWEMLLRPAGVPMGMVRSTGEFLSEPVCLHAGIAADLDDPEYGLTRAPGAAVRLSDAAPCLRPHQKSPVVAWRSADPGVAAPPTNSSAPPLAGLRVLDLSRALAAPTCARLLGELGADVCKIDVDPATIQATIREPALHLYTNRGKRGAVIDLKMAGGRDALRKLAVDTDIIVTNTLADRQAALGLSEADLRAANSKLIFSYLNSYGTTGEWATHRGYAEIVNAVTGIAARTSDWDRLPSGSAPANDPPWPYTDSLSGILATFATLLAVFMQRRHRIAQRAETTLAAAAMLEQINFAVRSVEHLMDEDAATMPTVISTLSGIYRTGDGFIFLGTVADDEHELAERLGIALPVTPEKLTNAVAGIDLAQCDSLLNFRRSAAHRVQALGDLLAAGGPADLRGLRVVHASRCNGTVVTPAPVIYLSRTPLARRPLAEPFGTETADVLAEAEKVTART